MKHFKLLRLGALLIGVGFAGVGLIGARSGLQSSSWRTAPARIVMSESFGGRSSVVMAEYRIGADIYQCGHVRLGRDNTPADARRHPVGSTATVAYDPGQTSRCALETGVSPVNIAFLMVGAGFLGLAVYFHRRLAQKPVRPV
jgi:hypothetical protein